MHQQDTATGRVEHPDPSTLLAPAGERGSAIVVGGSLSGLMTALSLARVGYGVTVIERTGPSPRSGAALRVDGEPHETISYSPGARRAAPSLRRITGGTSQRVQSWTAVHDRLRAAVGAEPRARMVHSTAVTEAGQDDTGAWAVTARGETAHADVLIGADGHRSVVRRSVAPRHPDAAFASYLLWIGIAPESAIPAGHRWPRGYDQLSYLSSGGYIMLGYPLDGPDGSRDPGARQVGWAWCDATHNALLLRQRCVVDGIVRHSLFPQDIPDETYRELAAEAEANWPQPWREAILDCVRRRAVTATPIAEYVPDRLVNGRLALVGDAGHVPTPMTGLGFEAALQDAEAIAESLSVVRHGREIPGALRDYERRRLATVRELVRSGQEFSRSFAARANEPAF
ncbi:FAD-dependent monooxygenase [Catenuloplanes atrovinosus]|uniref:2-polyprenyl-6-methoxyphenol hydroxylase-like FAD-dependent oxidoreductase n=1 Tax=Catenuloplanes atrovinosus TaxID=137266 RepID=A0AAE3YSX6_9ACTN|nr:FAD-dependent monooxygenase [Catenuloplanes atrovinosus]MDR7277266.1 2-polyprenyl-6-methoxyphenol hydroxylase-like FAD-dependent oxidoreductase [Catenuloplanes atrovinosus]